ncbi:MAG: transposase [Armatimonadetes bacterium]|nr:transposase [Armatimonadota bacterium]
MQRAYRTELNPNNAQRTLLVKHAGCARFAYNWGLAKIKDQTSKPNAMALHRELNARKQSDFPWMYEVSKCAMQEALRDLQRAFGNFFDKRAKFPTFKSKRHGSTSFRLTGTIKVEDRRIQLPRLGWLRLKEAKYIPQNAHVLSVTVSEQAGRWYVSVLVKEEAQPLKLDGVLGIDLGIKTLATCSDGTQYENPKALATYETQLKRLQRKMSRQQITSNRRKHTEARIARVWATIRNTRQDAIQKATTDIVKNKRCQVVALEDLNVRGMVKNHCLAKSVHDAGMRQFRTTLEYKQKWAGGLVFLVDRWFPSSKTCSACGVVKDKLSLRERTFVCEACGMTLDRDLNASVNLMYTASSAGINGRGDAKVHRLATV